MKVQTKISAKGVEVLHTKIDGTDHYIQLSAPISESVKAIQDKITAYLKGPRALPMKAIISEIALIVTLEIKADE